MRIIGGHDYYDGAGMGFDPTITFVRHKNPEDGLWREGDHPFSLPGGLSPLWKQLAHKDTHVFFGRLIVAGDIHPFIELYPARPRKNIPIGNLDFIPEARTAILYDRVQAQEAVQAVFPSDRFSFRTDPRKTLDAHFEKTTLSPTAQTWLLNNDITTLIHTAHCYFRQDPDRLYTNTATLKDYEAWKVIDPATAHMKIAQWVGGVLTNNPTLVALSDKDKIRKSGFDNWSFKTRPKQ